MMSRDVEEVRSWWVTVRDEGRRGRSSEGEIPGPNEVELNTFPSSAPTSHAAQQTHTAATAAGIHSSVPEYYLSCADVLFGLSLLGCPPLSVVGCQARN